MSRKDGCVFRRVVPRAVRAAARVLTVSERTKGDLVELYGVPPARIVVTPNGVDPAFTPSCEGPSDTVSQGSYVLRSGRSRRRKNQLAALEAAKAVGLPLVVVGPAKDPALADELRRRGARLEGYVETERLAELYRGRRVPRAAGRYEGFGLPVLEAMACGTPVVAVPEPALREVAGDAAVFVEEERLADGIRRALADRERLVSAGFERARAFTLAGDRREDARRVPGGTRRVKVSAVVVSHGHGDELDALAARARSPGRRDARDRERPGAPSGEVPAGVRVLENPRPLTLSANVNLGIAATSGEYVLVSNPDAVAGAGRGRGARRSSRTRIRAAGSPARRCAGRTAPGSRPGGASRRCAGRSCAARRSDACARRTRRSGSTTSSTSGRPSPSRPTGCSARSCSCAARCSRRSAAGTRASGTTARTSTSATARCRRAGSGGTCPDAVVAHDYAAVIDRRFLSRHTLWHARGMARFVRKHPERLLAL